MPDKKFKVLVVDDDVLLRELAATELAEEYEVQQAEDGLDALEKARAWAPDLVLTDLMMPRMHGYELCERLKGPGGVKDVIVVVASSKTFAADIAQAREAGADAYLTKPFNLAQMLSKVKELLLARAGGASAPAALRPAAPQEEYPAPSPAADSRGGKLPVSVRFWGTRGSCPVSGARTLRYGGNTPCVEVRVGDLPLILDCGSGLRELGVSMAAEFKGRPVNAHIFVGHTHWDHIQGFALFPPLYNPANSFNIYSVHGAHGSLKTVFSGTMSSDYFPVPLANLAAKLRFVEMKEAVDLGPAKVSYTYLNHPGVCIGFRIEAQGRCVCYLSDHEGYARLNGDSDLARRQDAEIISFTRGCDLLIREAQYTEEEYAPRRGWGHSTFDDAVRDAVAAGVRNLAITHHDPDHTDEAMDAYLARCRELAAGKVNCFGARDGMTLDL